MRRLRLGLAALVAALVLTLAAPPADAIGLQAARSQGLVGETPSGFVAPVKSPTADVRKLVSEVNAQRRSEYQRIASRNGLGVEQVGRITAEKLINGLPRGVFYQDARGSWLRK